MKPVVLIQRTAAGDAFRYSRFKNRESTHVVQMDSVAVGKSLPALTPDQVEQLREQPEQFVKEFL